MCDVAVLPFFRVIQCAQELVFLESHGHWRGGLPVCFLEAKWELGVQSDVVEVWFPIVKAYVVSRSLEFVSNKGTGFLSGGVFDA
jgi:hypothetical protein